MKDENPEWNHCNDSSIFDLSTKHHAGVFILHFKHVFCLPGDFSYEHLRISTIAS